MRTQGSGQPLVLAGGLLAFTMLGWTGLLMPALIREIQAGLAVTDADMGTAYLFAAIAFTIGCLLAGWGVSRIGRRAVLLGGIGALVAGSVGALIPAWGPFLVAAVLRGLGSGVIEVAVQGLFLYTFVGALQGRAINVVHFCYSLGAALAPLVIAWLVGLTLPWQVVIALAAVPWLIAGAFLAVAPMDGRVRRGAVPPARLTVTLPLVAAAIAIALYVAAEVGVSSWLVRFLADVDLGVAAAALSLFWAALAVSRLITARFGAGLPPEVLVVAGFVVAAVAIVLAVFVSSAELTIALFAVAGFAYGPVYPGIILVGARIPGRKDAVTSILASTAVVGAIVYPPLMGMISLGAGLGVAMTGAAVLSIVGAVLVVVAARRVPAWAAAGAEAGGEPAAEISSGG